MMPHVTVLMPAHNAGRFLGEAVESILAQTYEDFELLVIDDGSTDDTRAVLESFRDERLVYRANDRQLGVVATLNRGLDLAHGALISRHDADDLSEPGRLAVHVEMFDRDPELVIAGSAYSLIDGEGDVVGGKSRPPTDIAIRWRSLFLTPGIGAFTVRADVVRRHGVRFRIPNAAEDHGFWFDLLPLGRAANSREPLYRYRMHGSQASAAAFERQNAESDELARQSLARLGVDVPLGEMPGLREIYLEPPRRREPDSLRRFAAILAAGQALARVPEIDEAELRGLRRDMLAKLLVAARGQRWLPRALALAARSDAGGLVALARGRGRGGNATAGAA